MSDSTTPMRPGLLARIFGFDSTVGRGEYLLVGFALMALKLAFEVVLVRLATGTWWTLERYFDPTLKSRFMAGTPLALAVPMVRMPPPWLAWFLVLWTLPFIWTGVSMSVRRAADAGWSPWIGLLFLAPWINYVLMFVLALWPSSRKATWVRRADPHGPLRVGPAAGCALIGIALAIGMVLLGAKGLNQYSMYLFLGAPLVFGAATAFFLNRPFVLRFGATVGVILFSYAGLTLAVVFVGVEGFGCALMALVPAIPLAILGAAVGRAIAEFTGSRPRGALVAILALPLLAAVDRTHPELPVHEVVSSIEIAVPPEAVWEKLIAFGAIPDPPEWMFRLGIACPKGARIEGEGPGAVRYCEFTTGPFVEPITVWDPPRRLAFDVAAQPDPMVEWSPWDIHPAHLDGYLLSRRGEFRLVALEGGRTRLEGSTWYTLDMQPDPYWRLWTGFLIGSIHERVLRHVKRLSEAR